jgi:hypothetical protein
MEKLSAEFQMIIEELAGEVQGSEYLDAYLNAEEDQDEIAFYLQLQQIFEPQIQELYQHIADNHPLQLIDLETHLMDDQFEGLYLPRILAYSVLRGVVNTNFKYTRPQNHLRSVLLTLANSSNFEMLIQRIGQSLQLGFALSSDIWVTNLINEIGNKRVRSYFSSQRLLKYRDASERSKGLSSMRRQFAGENFYTTQFPEKGIELRTLYPEVKEFILQRVILKLDNENLADTLTKFAGNKDFWNYNEFVYVFGLVINYFDLNESATKELAKTLNGCRKDVDGFVDNYFEFLKELLASSRLNIKTECDKRVSNLIDRSNINDQFNAYYDLMDTIRSEGYDSELTLAEVQKFYFMNEGLSTINECVRLTLLAYFSKIISELSAEEYPRYIELSKVISQYINVFNNQQFNQLVGDICLDYLKKLIKHYTDKRSRDYQDIKKFSTSIFLDWQIMTDKQIAELFKTKRKPRVKKED